MLLRSLVSNQVSRLKTIVESTTASKDFYIELKANQHEIFFTVNETNSTIRYECLKDDQSIGIVVSIQKAIFDLYSNYQSLGNGNLPALDASLALYIHERETEDDPETLKNRYGRFYGLFARFSEFSESQLRVYSEQKKQLEQLLHQLDSQEADLPAATSSFIPAKLFVELSYFGVGRSNLTVSFSVEGGGKKKTVPILALQEVATRKGSFPLSTSVRTGATMITIDSFDEHDQKILAYLPVLASESKDYFNKSSKAVHFYYSLEPIIGLLNLCKGSIIQVNGNPFLVAEEEETCKIVLDQNGALSSSYEIEEDDLTIENKTIMVVISPSKKHIGFLRFPSQKTKLLYQFYIDHPDFDYSLFQEEIGGELLPKISQDMIVDKEFEERTKIYRSSIKYYLTYEDDQSLVMQTVFSIRGSEVSKEEFLDAMKPAIYDAFEAELRRLGLEEEGMYREADEIAPVLEQDFSTLSRLCSLYLSDNLTSKKVQHSLPIRVQTESDIDWFELKFSSDSLSGPEIQSILNAFKKKKKYVRIHDDYYALDNEELASLARKFDVGEGLTTAHLPIYQALRLNHDGKSIVTLTKQLLNLFHELGEYSSLELPLEEKFKKVLRPYQLDGVRWLYSLASHQLAGILADDMGLGKSLELISFLSLIKEKDPVLIVSPKSLIYNWKSEFEKWDDSREVFVFSGNKAERSRLFEAAKKSNRPILIVSYDTIRNEEEMFETIPYSVVVLDEGQYIANAFALKSKAVKKLKANHRFVLTGTPIQNSFLDLWSIFDFLLPGYLENYQEFQTIYRGFESVHSEQGKKLEKMVSPFILRRKKDDVLQDLPPKTEEIIRINFSDAEENLYSGYLANVHRELQEAEDKSKVAILAMLTRLRQLCVDPSSFLEYDDISTKLDYTLSMIEEAISGGHKVLVFSTFAEILLHLEALLKQRKIGYHLIYGQTTAAKRLSYAEDFNNNPNAKVMLVSLKAGGTGLNLIGADIVIHLDPWWNIAAEEQATDRAHRIGQTRPVSVYKLIMVNSVEEKVIELQEKKKELTAILHSEGEVVSGLTSEDLYYLLS